MKFRIVETVVSTGGMIYTETIEEFSSLKEASLHCERASNFSCYYHAYPLEDNATLDGRKT